MFSIWSSLTWDVTSSTSTPPRLILKTIYRCYIVFIVFMLVIWNSVVVSLAVIYYVGDCIRSTNWKDISYDHWECDLCYSYITGTSYVRYTMCRSLTNNSLHVSVGWTINWWLHVNSTITVFYVIVQIMKKTKHMKEERLRRHTEAVSSAFTLNLNLFIIHI